MSKKKKAKIPTFFVKSALKEYAKANGVQIGSDAYDRFNQEIANLLNAAFERTKNNKRKTLKAYDF